MLVSGLHGCEFPVHAGMNRVSSALSSRMRLEFPVHAGMNRVDQRYSVIVDVEFPVHAGMNRIGTVSMSD